MKKPPVLIWMRNGRLMATSDQVHDSSNFPTLLAAAINEVFTRWADQAPQGCHAPCWEEVFQQLLCMSELIHVPRKEWFDASFVVRALTNSVEAMFAARWRLRRMARRERQQDGIWYGNPVCWDGVPEQAWSQLCCDQPDAGVRIIRLLSYGVILNEHERDWWIQVDDGTPFSGDPHPFLEAVDIGERLAKGRTPVMEIHDKRLVATPGASGAPDETFLLNVVPYLRADLVRPLRFESVLRTLEALGVNLRKLGARGSTRILLGKDRQPAGLITYDAHVPDGAGGVHKCRIALGGSIEELRRGLTIETLWEEYGLSEVSLDDYLKLRTGP